MKEQQIKFTQFSKAFYATSQILEKNVVDIISITDGQGGELSIKWIDLGRQIAPRLDAFDDAWGLLFSQPELLEALSSLNNSSPSTDRVIEQLISLGYEDITPIQPN